MRSVPGDLLGDRSGSLGEVGREDLAEQLGGLERDLLESEIGAEDLLDRGSDVHVPGHDRDARRLAGARPIAHGRSCAGPLVGLRLGAERRGAVARRGEEGDRGQQRRDQSFGRSDSLVAGHGVYLLLGSIPGDEAGGDPLGVRQDR